MKIVPLRNQVFLKRHTSEEFIGRIIVPQSAREKLLWADVVAVGPGKLAECEVCERRGEVVIDQQLAVSCDACGGAGWKRRPPIDVKPGDTVIFKLHAEEIVAFTEETLEAIGYSAKDSGDIVSTYAWACVARVSNVEGKTVVTPLGDYVLCKKDAPDKMTSGGIVIPDEYQEEIQREKGAWGTVIAVGAAATDVKVASRVLFPQYGGTPVRVEGEEFVIHGTGSGGDLLAIAG